MYGRKEDSLTAFWQHALLALLQFLRAVGGIRLEHPLARAHSHATRHAAPAPVRPRGQHTRCRIWDYTHTHTHTRIHTHTHLCYSTLQVSPTVRRLLKVTAAQFLLTAVWHHAFVHLKHLRFTHGSIQRRHLHHALPPSHAQPTGGAAGVPLAPLCHDAAAGS